MDVVEGYCDAVGIAALRVDGTVERIDRLERMEEFNKDGTEFNMFILSTHACGTGLNLQSADTVILLESDYNPQNDAQAKARAHRVGQTREVRTFRLLCGNAEFEMFQKFDSLSARTAQLILLFCVFRTERKRRLASILDADVEPDVTIIHADDPTVVTKCFILND